MTTTTVAARPETAADAAAPPDPRWARPGLLALLAATAVLYLWGLGSSGWANSYYAAAAQAVERIRMDGAPRFLELVTYRQRGHYEPDDQAYVDRAELDRWVARDPIRVFAERLLAEGAITLEILAAMELRAKARIDAAAAFAEASPWPSPQALTEHVYI